MIRTKIPMAAPIAVRAPFWLDRTDRRNEQTESQPGANDGVLRADALDNFLNLYIRRGEAIRATVAVFRRYPELRVFYVETTGAGFDGPGWYSQPKRDMRAEAGDPAVTLGPFPSHLEAQNAWMRR